ncbi:MAG: glycerate kinase [Alphaproteobacteria bacterium]
MDRRLMALFEAALDAARAEHCVPRHLPEAPAGRTVVVGAGKAVAAMAKAVEDHWPGPLEGLVVTRYGHGIATRRIEVVEAGHPVPDAEGIAAARRIVELLEGLGKDDLALLLVSGGGSALLSLPAPGLTLEDKQVLTTELLRAGATIHEINTVRKHLSAVKGGRLALRAHPARLVSLMISDVAGDDPAVIASGPGVADPTTFADARAVLAKYRIGAPPAIALHLAGAGEETPKPGDPRLASAETRLIATPSMAFAAAAERAEKEGLSAVLLGDELEGEARALARAHGARALEYRRDPTAQTKPRVLLSGGETTVTLTGPGRGGPNAEYLLALALALDGAAGIHALACDTDGIDGSEDNAGAVIAPDTLARARAHGLNAAEHLARNDSYGFFSALGDLVVTGPTLTNVNDFRAILIEPL